MTVEAHTFYDIEADEGKMLHNIYSDEICKSVYDVMYLDDWEEIEEPLNEPGSDHLEEQPVLKASPRRARRTRKTKKTEE